MNSDRKTALFWLDNIDSIYSIATQKRLEERFEFSKIEDRGATQLLFTSWGCPRFDDATLDSMPNLEAVFYAAGSVRHLITDAFWQRNITLATAWTVNAIPVAEFTVAHIILSLKHAYRLSRQMHQLKQKPEVNYPCGVYQASVGLVGLGITAKLVVQKLREMELTLYGFDPTFSPEQFAELGVIPLNLNQLFAQSDIVSLHAPLLDSTKGMISGALIDQMKPGSTLINTARGGLILEDDLITVLKRRDDLFAVCDVTTIEPLSAQSELYGLSNVLLTPHIAGSMGRECWRLGDAMAGEAMRYINGLPLKWKIDQASARKMA